MIKKHLSTDLMAKDHRIIIYTAALSLHSKFVVPLGVTQMCYRLAIFLSTYLKERYGINATPVIGYADDGESAFSHGWLDYEGTITDISLTIVDNPYIRRGGLRILDHDVIPGEVRYEYHRDLPEHHVERRKILQQNPISRAIFQHKAIEHKMLQEIARNTSLWRPYLDGAPDGYDFDTISRIIEPAS